MKKYVLFFVLLFLGHQGYSGFDFFSEGYFEVYDGCYFKKCPPGVFFARVSAGLQPNATAEEKAVSEKIIANLRRLDLSNQQLSEFPLVITELVNLSTLILSGCGISTLPDEIGKLTKLYSLKLQNNPITKFPDEIGKLTDLHFLDISNCKLTEFPENILNLVKLQKLNAAQNSIKSLPLGFGKLNISELCLSNNCFFEFPREILSLRYVRYIGFAYNNIAFLPHDMWRLSRSKCYNSWVTLNLCGNKLTHLQEQERDFLKEIKISLGENPLPGLEHNPNSGLISSIFLLPPKARKEYVKMVMENFHHDSDGRPKSR
ncbi:leucine-rich repeat domain-containing protein [bacterium]|nr:leucine-rich repeat domain-containing protein [bacterium]